MLQFIPNALWAMRDAHSRMIHYFESVQFKGLIKPVGKPVNLFVNQLMVRSVPSFMHGVSEAVLTQSCNKVQEHQERCSRRNAI